ncbi:uncharacterized protein FFUJ_09027 [Fusarium fujikuroi IMI 58289]|uniref:Uncharacterized protein n=1 Tax=Gibberella fujikuroi (strain CBS 195.34 / IMI 58289 / NRRL A-6831) TaxID=1279085 RepID=S0E7V1_GIBF5|nr:uncharacterized protein FFUJ_09027 [Fusarium fujikuroi IMI 58289]QGI66665.1 hypothetical protein CEK27_010636 [Fusarium fujikuroi]QGI83903.1 hypothetical protein CEK25_010632 [Fusarium fujikuroi]QGI97555.1 hypothetical protein CEK26_010624 [Fusarium fujikuroi]CCT70946.1 uncharacterized protein FFUJ_09027 [Fusarium fujikuroi IMI 58289]SCO02622.1 uncharacterized protein FFM5_07909 [Fusarium fujikuroi]
MVAEKTNDMKEQAREEAQGSSSNQQRQATPCSKDQDPGLQTRAEALEAQSLARIAGQWPDDEDDPFANITSLEDLDEP